MIPFSPCYSQTDRALASLQVEEASLEGQSGHSLKIEGETLKREDVLCRLPILIERLIIALRGGYDIFSALKIVTHERSQDNLFLFFSVIITRAENGESFSDLLYLTASKTTISPLKATLLYLETSYRIGGDIISPLLEVADNAQASYQDLIEERIAGLPAKATIPLAMTFLGLIIIFLAPPLLQLSAILEKVEG